jgi:hypothetical protein
MSIAGWRGDVKRWAMPPAQRAGFPPHGRQGCWVFVEWHYRALHAKLKFWLRPGGGGAPPTGIKLSWRCNGL